MPGTDARVDAGGLAEAVELTLHGMIANLPAHTVQVTADAAARVITVTGQVDEAGLFVPSLRLSTSISAGPDSSRITVADTVRNLQETPAELQLLYHCNYGPPFLGEGSRVLLPVTEAAPRDARSAEGVAEIERYGGPTPGFVQQAYWIRPAARPGDTASLAALVNPSRTAAAVMRFDIGELPCFSLWKNTAGERDGYVTGLEPGHQLPQPQERRARRRPGGGASRGRGVRRHGDAGGRLRGRRPWTPSSRRSGRSRREPRPPFTPSRTLRSALLGRSKPRVKASRPSVRCCRPAHLRRIRPQEARLPNAGRLESARRIKKDVKHRPAADQGRQYDRRRTLIRREPVQLPFPRRNEYC